jgi:hypothetical protein
MLGQMMFEGAARMAQLVPLLFALNTTAPASAQLPRRSPSAPPAPFAAAVEESSPLTLTGHHADVRIEDGRAHVRSLLTYRNERAEPVSTSFAFPFPTLLEQGETWRALGEESIEPSDDCGGDVSAADAEFLEAGERVPPRVDVGYVTVAPGEEITLETHRVVDLARYGYGYRLVLPLPVDRSAPYAPQFTADVAVDGTQAIKQLASPTHGGPAAGLGSRHAQLAVPGGRAYIGPQFVVDIEFDANIAAPRYALWGGETHAR